MIYDCLVIGGGPAGLTGAIYLARYRRKVLVLDGGASRASSIPATHNHPGFAEISGPELLRRLRRQAQDYGVEHWAGQVLALRKEDGVFVADTTQGSIRASFVLLATGIKNRQPNVPGWSAAVERAVVRYCPVCDGFEALDRKIAVWGSLKDAARKAEFLRTYSNAITVLSLDETRAPDALEGLRAARIEVALSCPQAIQMTTNGIEILLRNGERLEFDVLYAALGCEVHSELARGLGAECDPTGCIAVDAKQQSAVQGLYAAGDVVSDLHQLAVAEGHAAIAATAIHNCLPNNFR